VRILKRYVRPKIAATWREPVSNRVINHSKTETHIERCEGEHETKIPPMVLIENVEAVDEELIRRPRTAIIAGLAGLRVGQISSGERDKVLHIRCASLSGRWGELNEFDRRAVDLLSSKCLAEETFDQVGVGRKAIHPSPPAELAERLHDTVAERQIVRQEGHRNRNGKTTHNERTKENSRENSRAAISALGAIAATAWSTWSTGCYINSERKGRTWPMVV
jgi:hypothetical protein